MLCNRCYDSHVLTKSLSGRPFNALILMMVMIIVANIMINLLYVLIMMLLSQ